MYLCKGSWLCASFISPKGIVKRLSEGKILLFLSKVVSLGRIKALHS